MKNLSFSRINNVGVIFTLFNIFMKKYPIQYLQFSNKKKLNMWFDVI